MWCWRIIKCTKCKKLIDKKEAVRVQFLERFERGKKCFLSSSLYCKECEPEVCIFINYTKYFFNNWNGFETQEQRDSRRKWREEQRKADIAFRY
jgi:hypothetical protein